jgi:hypothetical protein
MVDDEKRGEGEKETGSLRSGETASGGGGDG